MIRAAKTLWVAAAAVSVSLLAGGTAEAATPAKVKVLGMQVEGADLSAKDKADLFQVVQAKLRSYPQIDLLKPPERELTDEMIDLECLDIDLECLVKLGKKYGAESVFYSQVDTKGAGFELLVRVADVGKNELVRDEKTAVSSRMGLANTLETEVEAVFGAPPAATGDVGYLEIKASVPGAKIFVNGDYAGAGSVKLKKEPGTYTIRVSRDGYDEVVTKVVVVKGETATREVTLEESEVIKKLPPKDKPDEDPEFYETWWFWTIVGVAVVGTTVGVVVATTDSESSAVGNVTFSVDPQNAWRDVGVQGGAP